MQTSEKKKAVADSSCYCSSSIFWSEWRGSNPRPDGPKWARTCDLGVFKLHTVLSARKIMLFGGLFYAVSVASEARCGQLCGRKNVSAYDVICSCPEQQNLREAIIVCIVALTLRKVNRFAGFSLHRICDGIIKEKGFNTGLLPAK